MKLKTMSDAEVALHNNLAERLAVSIESMVWAFADSERREAVRRLANDVRRLKLERVAP